MEPILMTGITADAARDAMVRMLAALHAGIEERTARVDAEMIQAGVRILPERTLQDIVDILFAFESEWDCRLSEVGDDEEEA